MNPSNPRYWIAGLCVLAAFVGSAIAQEDRFLIEPGVPAAVTHLDLQNSVTLVGGDFFLSIDRPNVNGNVVGARLDPQQLNDLQIANPGYIIEPDLPIQQNGPPAPPAWSPDRIDQRVGMDGMYSPVHLDCDGSRVYVYVCDTGIEPNHDEFHMAGPLLHFMPGYVSQGLWDPLVIPPPMPPLRPMGSEYIDPQDHGTGTASCVIGASTGSARSPINLVSACFYPLPGMLPGPGTFAGYAVEAIDWAADEHYNRTQDDDPYNDASVLLFPHSTVGGRSTILDNAVKRARDVGMVVIVSAGNSNADIAGFSPAGTPEIFTVGASDVTDMKWLGSNWGAVDLWAPGDLVAAASSIGPDVCNMVSGTSFSAGLVGGSAARILSLNPWASPSHVETILSDPQDPIFGPTPISGSTAPLLAYIHPSEVPCIPMTYSAWAAREGISSAGLRSDLELDGLDNMMEYFMALDPESDSSGLGPSIGVEEGQIHYRFRMAKYLDHESFEYRVEITDDLATWTELPDSFIMPDESAPCSIGAIVMVATVPVPNEEIYLRLRVHTDDGVVVNPGGGGVGM